jgi:hypothetical protein
MLGRGDFYRERRLGSECARRLWTIRIAADRYYVLEHKYPESIDNLVQAGLLNKNLVCPASREFYLIQQNEGRTFYACPSPEFHGLGSLKGDLRSGAPRAEKF